MTSCHTFKYNYKWECIYAVSSNEGPPCAVQDEIQLQKKVKEWSDWLIEHVPLKNDDIRARGDEDPLPVGLKFDFIVVGLRVVSEVKR